MTCKINADTSNGLKLTSDTSGAVQLQSNGTTRTTFLANGNIGIGITSPASKLDIAGNLLVDAYNNAGAGGGIFLRGGFLTTAQPSITLVDHNGSAPDGISVNGYDGVAFRTSNVERGRFTEDGKLFVTNANNLSDTNNANLALNHTVATRGMNIHTTGTSNSERITFQNDNGTVGAIGTNGSATYYNTSSDYRLKENVDYTFDATTRLKQLKPSRFNFISDDTNTLVDGFLAHEVSSIVPEAIFGTKDAVEKWKEGEELPDGISVGDNKLDDDGNNIPTYQAIDQSKLVPLLVKTIQELEARITALES